jgi:serine/threonine protein kinase
MSSVYPIKFGEKYTLLDLIGVGGVAEVFRGKLTGDKGFEKLIVIKKLLAEHVADQEMVEIFIGEAKLAALLQHENIAATYDFGDIDGEYFLAMEYLFGKNLHSFMARAKQHQDHFRLEHALAVASRICEGMDYAHHLRDLQNKPLNIVHRDLTPHNIFITYDGKVKILDFGVAKAELFDNKTREGVVKGKISYMSPERLSGEQIDARSDIFSIGILLYEMISKQRMYRGDTAELIRKCISVDYQNLDEIVPNLRPEVYAILDKALAIDVEQRYQSCARMHSDIEDLLFQMQARADARFLKQSIQALFAEEYAAEQLKSSTALQAELDGRVLGHREKTDISIPRKPATEINSLPEDRTQVLPKATRFWITGRGWAVRKYRELALHLQHYQSALMKSQLNRRMVLIALACFVGFIVVLASFMSDEEPVVVTQPEPVLQQSNDAQEALAGQPVKDDTEQVQEAPEREARPAAEAVEVKSSADPAAAAERNEDAVQAPEYQSPPEADTVLPLEATKLLVLKEQHKKVKSDSVDQSQPAAPFPGGGRGADTAVARPAAPFGEQQTAAQPVDIATQTLRFDAAAPSAEKQPGAVAGLHEKAAAALQGDHLLWPTQDSAYSYYQEILRLNPEDHVAKDGLRLIGDRYSVLAEEALNAQRFSEADGYVNSGLSVVPDYQRLLATRKRIKEERARRISELAAKADQSLAEDKLTTPEGDSAYFYYNEIFRIDPESPLVLEGFADIAERYATLGDEAYRGFNFEMAQIYVERGLRIMPNHYYLLSLKKDLERGSTERYMHSLKKNFNKLFSE